MCTFGSNKSLWMKFKNVLFIIVILIFILIIIIGVLMTAFIFHETLDDLIVELPTGKIKGRKDISLKRNVSFYSFLQIPYGQPPTGKLRFMSPKPAEKWDGVLDCTNDTKKCYEVIRDDDRETEDCLYLNVYTPVKPGSNSSLPVMFYIFGNAFCCKLLEYRKYGPHYFMEEGVIIVTFSYRIGPFGFLSTDDEVVLGNAGLKDQNLALKWTHQNIHLFGGDPNKITIFGSSSGSTSTSYQILSKKSAGLFRAAICQSGSGLSHCPYRKNARTNAYKLATLVNPHFNTNCSSRELLDFLQSVNASTLDKTSKLLKSSLEIYRGDYMLQCPFFGPVIEPNVEDAFVTELTYKSFTDGNFSKVPLIIGICSEEGLCFVKNLHHFKKLINRYEKEPDLFVSPDFDINDKYEKQHIFNLSRKIYTDGLFVNNLSAAVKYLSDNLFTRPIIEQAYIQSNYNDVYFYKFSYHGDLGRNILYLNGTERVAHSEEINYLWCTNNVSNISDLYTQNDVTTLERFLRLLTNFAKYLNPTPEPEDLLQNITWPKFMSNNSLYLNINKSLEIKTNPIGDIYKKWMNLFQMYANRDYDKNNTF